MFIVDNCCCDILKFCNIVFVSFVFDNCKWSYEGIVCGVSVGEKFENEKRKYSMVYMFLNYRYFLDYYFNVVENVEWKIFMGFFRYYEKCNIVIMMICIFIIWVIIDDCGVGVVIIFVVVVIDIDVFVMVFVLVINIGGEFG